MFGEDYKRQIDETVRELHFVGENNVIELYADYNDTAEFLLQTVYDNRNGEDLEALVQEQICEAYIEQQWECEDGVLKKAGVLGTDLEEDAREYLQNTYFFEPPFDHYLDQEIKVNIMLATDEERNCQYGNIREQYLSMARPEEVWHPEESLAEHTSLRYLLEQQGSSMAELHQTMKHYDAVFNGDYDDPRPVGADGEPLSLSERVAIFNETHDSFLTSVCSELEEQRYKMGVMTVLAKMSIREFIEMQRGEKQITMPKDSFIGVFNPWEGAGGLLEIELKKPLVFSTDMIRDVQIEGAILENEYSVDSAFGFVGSCWKQPVGIVSRELTQPSLDEQIQDAVNIGALNAQKDIAQSIEQDMER